MYDILCCSLDPLIIFFLVWNSIKMLPSLLAIMRGTAHPGQMAIFEQQKLRVLIPAALLVGKPAFVLITKARGGELAEGVGSAGMLIAANSTDFIMGLGAIVLIILASRKLKKSGMQMMGHAQMPMMQQPTVMPTPMVVAPSPAMQVSPDFVQRANAMGLPGRTVDEVCMNALQNPLYQTMLRDSGLPATPANVMTLIQQNMSRYGL